MYGASPFPSHGTHGDGTPAAGAGATGTVPPAGTPDDAYRAGYDAAMAAARHTARAASGLVTHAPTEPTSSDEEPDDPYATWTADTECDVPGTNDRADLSKLRMDDYNPLTGTETNFSTWHVRFVFRANAIGLTIPARQSAMLALMAGQACDVLRGMPNASYPFMVKKLTKYFGESSLAQGRVETLAQLKQDANEHPEAYVSRYVRTVNRITKRTHSYNAPHNIRQFIFSLYHESDQTTLLMLSARFRGFGDTMRSSRPRPTAPNARRYAHSAGSRMSPTRAKPHSNITPSVGTASNAGHALYTRSLGATAARTVTPHSTARMMPSSTRHCTIPPKSAR
jgi:hypothetical protein